MDYQIESIYNVQVWVDVNNTKLSDYGGSFPTFPFGYKSKDGAVAAVKAVFQKESAAGTDRWIGFDVIRTDKHVYIRPDNYSWQPDVIEAKYRFGPLRPEDGADKEVVAIDRGFNILPRIANDRRSARI